VRIAIAIGVSVLVHLILAGGLVWYFTKVPAPVVLVHLDLSSVELSIAEEDVESAVPVRTTPKPIERPPEPPKPIERPPEPIEPNEPLPARPEPLPAPEKQQAEPRPQEAPASVPAPTVAPKQAKIDAPPKPKHAIRPDYPRTSRLRKEEGDVVLELHITASGGVSAVRVVTSSGFTALDEAAVKAAKAAHFMPAKSGAESVSSVARLTLTFKLK